MDEIKSMFEQILSSGQIVLKQEVSPITIAPEVEELVEVEDKDTLMSTLDLGEPAQAEDLTILDRTVQALSVDDFAKLFSRQNMIAIIVMSILFGIAANMSGEKAKPVVDFLDSATDIVMNLLKIIMYYAPIGLGVYFAVLIGTFGASLALGYAKTFIVYTLVSIVFFFVAYSIYAYIAGGKKGFKIYVPMFKKIHIRTP
mgnify:CR=1 FL=1